ncbi:MAG: response regulator [Verrucomicrobia bacterium]|nr:response regulator [Verrucomicrobiota bacterium]MBT7701185.1 response regulator [Verrucomicrobiota bacterium]
MSETHKILVIDDDARDRVVLKTVLSGSSYEIWEAARGEEGLELARDQPDLIILDVGLPDVNGFEVCQRLRAEPETRRIPVLHLSGEFVDDDDRAAGLEGGAHGYLVKPVANNVLLATVRSLLRMRDAERALAGALRKAEAANAAKTRFLARITQRLRIPLNAVMGTAGSLMASALTPRQREHTVTIRRHADRLLSLVNDVLDATRLDMHNVALEETEFDPRATCADVFDMVRERAEVKQLDLLSETTPEVPALVRADAGRFRQVLLHLVDNAVTFTQAGSVTLRLSAESSDDGGSRLHVDVVDTGDGVPPERERELFVPLAPLDQPESEPFAGSGLGLAISHAVIALMGGTIGYRPGEQGGAVFWFVLPVRPAAAVPPAADVDRSDTIAGLHVLVVDDNGVNRKVARGILKGLGCDVVLADSGEAALDVTQQEPFDAILMDLSMPGMDGFETTQKIRDAHRAAGQPRTPIIAVTAQTDEASRQHCALADMDGYIATHYAAAALEASCRSMGQSRSARRKREDSNDTSGGR